MPRSALLHLTVTGRTRVRGKRGSRGGREGEVIKGEERDVEGKNVIWRVDGGRGRAGESGKNGKEGR